MRPPRLLLLVLCVLGVFARAEEPFFKKGDVIAIVGGEDMVALSEYGYLELLLTRALPDYHLRFRNLAWEGDTVFEQRRDLGFPPWEEQLEKIGATVVLCQFGQMESLGIGEGRKAKGERDVKAEVAEFIAAYEKLLARFSGGGKRRLVLVGPVAFVSLGKIGPSNANELERDRLLYSEAVSQLAKRENCHFVETGLGAAIGWSMGSRDGVHLNDQGQMRVTMYVGNALLGSTLYQKLNSGRNLPLSNATFMKNEIAARRLAEKAEGDMKVIFDLDQFIRAKNRLWFDYWRVQNWAFLAGDRTNQPSSRDHLDPAKRWFPEERERFLPLIEAREKEIDALAAKLAQP